MVEAASLLGKIGDRLSLRKSVGNTRPSITVDGVSSKAGGESEKDLAEDEVKELKEESTVLDSRESSIEESEEQAKREAEHGTPAPDGSTTEGFLPSRQIEMEHFYGHLERALDSRGFLDGEMREVTLTKLRRFFSRARPNSSELKIFHTLMKLIERSRDGPGRSR